MGILRHTDTPRKERAAKSEATVRKGAPCKMQRVRKQSGVTRKRTGKKRRKANGLGKGLASSRWRSSRTGPEKADSLPEALPGGSFVFDYVCYDAGIAPKLAIHSLGRVPGLAADSLLGGRC